MTTNGQQPGSHEPAVDDAADAARSPESDDSSRSTPTMLEQMGGVSGLIASTVPVVVFVPVNSLLGLNAAIGAAIAAAIAVFIVRLVRKEPLQPAVSGLIGVAVCAFIAYRTGDAKGYFLFGIWTALIYAAVFVLSVVVRYPLVGVAWTLVNGEGLSWRKNRRVLLAYDAATLVWALFFGLRFVVQNNLYENAETGWLAFARIAMGWPLTALALLITVVLVRWAHKHTPADPEEAETASSSGSAA